MESAVLDAVAEAGEDRRAEVGGAGSGKSSRKEEEKSRGGRGEKRKGG